MKKILIIEDDPIDVEVVKRRLTSMNKFEFELIHYITLSKGLFELEEQKDFDLVILDIGLPEARGTDTLTKFLEVNKGNVPYIVYSGLENEEVTALGQNNAAYKFILKDKINSDDFDQLVDGIFQLKV